jgi:hypothetical protein
MAAAGHSLPQRAFSRSSGDREFHFVGLRCREERLRTAENARKKGTWNAMIANVEEAYVAARASEFRGHPPHGGDLGGANTAQIDNVKHVFLRTSPAMQGRGRRHVGSGTMLAKSL